MKKSYRFVGGLPSHMMGVVSFTSWGQAAALTEEQARDLSVGGSAIVRDEDFATLGVTPQESVKYGPFGAHLGATPEFTAKKLAAVGLAEKLRAEFEAPKEEAA